ncbi:MAG: hypothetical protein ACTH4U_18315 [Pseudoalteromonas prydzensis]|uniref:hypothetical protein n=1 Tax=Pseudoalteromonas prydzensis TaxID=182141 RepID=UPI003F9A30BF
MIKNLIWICLSALFLSACSDVNKQYQSEEQAQQALHSLNQFLRPTSNSTSASVSESQWPFSDAYLKERHTIYQAMQSLELAPVDKHLLDYLIIAERFPQRYFSWPVYIPVLENMLEYNQQQDISAGIAGWIRFTQQQLVSAQESKLRLNSIELTALQMQVAKSLAGDDLPAIIKQTLTDFNVFLASYTPRGSAGLHGLSNGGPWYQSKLNYFSGTTKAPINWLVAVQSQLQASQQEVYSLNLAIDHQHSVLEQRFAQSKNQPHGFDWAQNYHNLSSSAQQVAAGLSDEERTFWLTMMETDLGIHYHAWTVQQAKVNLLKRLKMTPQQVDYLVADIIFYPAQSFAFATLLTTP